VVTASLFVTCDAEPVSSDPLQATVISATALIVAARGLLINTLISETSRNLGQTSSGEHTTHRSISVVDSPRIGARSHFDDEQRPPTGFSRRHLLFAGLAATATVGYATYSLSEPSDADPTPNATRNTGTAATTPPSSLPEPVAVAAEAITTTVRELTQDLSEGMVGDDVEALQAALGALSFDPGPIDGIFGGATVRSVWAFEKIVLGTPRTEMRGIVTPDIWEQMNSDVQIAPRRTPGGTHMEVYLPEQVSVLFVDGEARVISHVSSGENIEWCDVVKIDLEDGTTEEKGICGISKTPGGVYHFERKVDGWRNAKLGRLYQPVYFNYGIAIHGAGNVPDYPASRGCVRHPMHIAEYLPDLIEIGDAIYVFDGVEEPETYGAAPMIFDYPDPDWIPPTTTTTTSTTVPAPATTQPPSTTSTTSSTTTSSTSPPSTTTVPSSTLVTLG
jgi:peptidoglycan hydrolase-like protein with peptidoglycan-binding domain